MSVSVPQQVSVGQGGPPPSTVGGVTNAELNYTGAITNIVARYGSNSHSDIEITVLTLWPFQMDSSAHAEYPQVSSEYAVQPMAGVISVEGACSNSSQCVQKFRFTIEHDGACVLDGDYVINQFPVTCMSNLPNGTDCANTTASLTVTLAGVNICDKASAAIDDIWRFNMTGHNGRRAILYTENFPIDVTITKLKELGQTITNLTIMDVQRSVPGSANPACVAPSSVLSKTQLVWSTPNLFATVYVLMDATTVCDVPQRGYRTELELDFTYRIDLGWNGRRRRHTVKSRQLPGSSSDKRVTTQWTVAASESDLSPTPQSSAITPAIPSRTVVMLVAVLAMLAAQWAVLR